MDGYNTLGSVWLIERDGEGAAITVWRLRMQIVMKMVVTLRIISRFTDAKIIIFRQMDATLLDFFFSKRWKKVKIHHRRAENPLKIIKNSDLCSKIFRDTQYKKYECKRT